MKKLYVSPIIRTNHNSLGMAVPLAFFSAATAAAAVVGTVAGAASAAHVMGNNRILKSKKTANQEILGLVI